MPVVGHVLEVKKDGLWMTVAEEKEITPLRALKKELAQKEPGVKVRINSIHVKAGFLRRLKREGNGNGNGKKPATTRISLARRQAMIHSHSQT